MAKKAEDVPSSIAELERMTALETLKRLQQPERVPVMSFVEFLERHGWWEQFAKLTIEDLRRGFASQRPPARKKRRERIFASELGLDEPERAAAPREGADRPLAGGWTTEQVADLVIPFLEGNGEVTFDDLADYARIDRKDLRHHLAILVKQGRLERIGVGRQAIYAAAG